MTDDEMYEAVIHNDANYDGLFFYGVKSTGIFCRPSCASKIPVLKNVVFFNNAKEAMNAGFRPCKRCRSDLLSYQPMNDMAQLLKNRIDEQYQQRSPWNEDIKTIGLSKRRMVEVFKEAYQITPKVYMDTLKLNEAKQLLVNTNDKISDIAQAVGFGSLPTFNRFFKEQTGQTPRAYRQIHKK